MGVGGPVPHVKPAHVLFKHTCMIELAVVYSSCSGGHKHNKHFINYLNFLSVSFTMREV